MRLDGRGFARYVRPMPRDTVSAHSDAPNPPNPSVPSDGLRAADYGLYAATLFAWGTSWYALKLNAVADVAPEVSVLYRFGLAAVIMAVWIAFRGGIPRLSPRAHLRLVAMGATLFSFNFLCFYYAALSLPSGLLAVLFSLSSVMIVIASAVLARRTIEGPVLGAAALGVAGIILIFWPEVATASAGLTADSRSGLAAIGLCLLGNTLFMTGNLLSARAQGSGLPVVETNALGMAYGGVMMLIVALFTGAPFAFETSAAYIGSLLWLAVFSSVVAFAAYLTLLGRIGPARAGYLTVMFPLVALAISTMLEGYRWTSLAGLGVGLVLVGNIIVLRGRRIS